MKPVNYKRACAELARRLTRRDCFLSDLVSQYRQCGTWDQLIEEHGEEITNLLLERATSEFRIYFENSTTLESAA